MNTAPDSDNVIVVGAGPVGCTAALLLADQGVPVTLLERHLQPHPLPRAVHLDDEVVRILHRVGVSNDFLARSRPATGLRLVDDQRRLLAEFSREITPSDNGFPYANMFHQPDLEALLLDRVEQHPLVSLHRGVEVDDIYVATDASAPYAVRVDAPTVEGGERVGFPGRLLLGCDGANSTVRELLGVPMNDLKFTERWLVIDVRTDATLDTWGGVEQVCDPARAATFMRVVGDRYRWEFQLHDDEDEADLIRPDMLGHLLSPWTGRRDVDGLEIVRSATYTFRARLARRFQVGPVFLLGDAAHLTPPFIGQGLGAGLRDAANLSWKVAHVLSGRATVNLLTTYDAERRPHARALIKRAVQVGWVMTGGQGRAAGGRRVALALAVRSKRVRDGIARPVTPPLAHGALDCRRRGFALAGRSGPFRVGALMPNAVVADGTGAERRLDDVLAGRMAVVTGTRPSLRLVDSCRREDVLLLRVGLHPFVRNRRLAVVVRPDGVIGAVSRGDLPMLPPVLARPAATAAPTLVVAR